MAPSSPASYAAHEGPDGLMRDAFELTRENMKRMRQALRAEALHDPRLEDVHPFDQARRAAAVASAGIADVGEAAAAAGRAVDPEAAGRQQQAEAILRKLDANCRQGIEQIVHDPENGMNGLVEAILLEGSLRERHDMLRQVDAEEDGFDHDSFVRDREHTDEWLALTAERLVFEPREPPGDRASRLRERVSELLEVDDALVATHSAWEMGVRAERDALGERDALDTIVPPAPATESEATRAQPEATRVAVAARARCQKVLTEMGPLIGRLGDLGDPGDKQPPIVAALRHEHADCADWDALWHRALQRARELATLVAEGPGPTARPFAQPLRDLQSAVFGLEARTERRDVLRWRPLQKLRARVVDLERELAILFTPCQSDASNSAHEAHMVMHVMQVLTQAQDRALIARELVRRVEARQALVEFEVELCRKAHQRAAGHGKAYIRSTQVGFCDAELRKLEAERSATAREFLSRVWLSKAQVCDGVLPGVLRRLESQRQRLLFRWRVGQIWVARLVAKYGLSTSLYAYINTLEKRHTEIDHLHVGRPAKDVAAAAAAAAAADEDGDGSGSGSGSGSGNDGAGDMIARPPSVSPFHLTTADLNPSACDELYEAYYVSVDHEEQDRVAELEEQQRHIAARRRAIGTRSPRGPATAGAVDWRRFAGKSAGGIGGIARLRALELQLRKRVTLELKRRNLEQTYRADDGSEDGRASFAVAAIAAETNLARVEVGVRLAVQRAIEALAGDTTLTTEGHAQVRAVLDTWYDMTAFRDALCLVRGVVQLLSHRAAFHSTEAELGEENSAQLATKAHGDGADVDADWGSGDDSAESGGSGSVSTAIPPATCSTTSSLETQCDDWALREALEGEGGEGELDEVVLSPASGAITGLEGFLSRSRTQRRTARSLKLHEESWEGRRERCWNASTSLCRDLAVATAAAANQVAAAEAAEAEAELRMSPRPRAQSAREPRETLAERLEALLEGPCSEWKQVLGEE